MLYRCYRCNTRFSLEWAILAMGLCLRGLTILPTERRPLVVRSLPGVHNLGVLTCSEAEDTSPVDLR